MSEWERCEDGWARLGLVLIEYSTTSGKWNRTDVSGAWYSYDCPDAAREAADAYLVSQERLDKARAFVRLGEWADGAASRWVRHATAAASMVFADNDLDRARRDAELVASGALDPSRAFKATTENTPSTMTRIQPQMHNSVPPEVARAAKPSAVSVQRIFLPGSTESFTVEGTGARPFCVQRSPDGQMRVTDWNGANCVVGPGDVLTYTITDGVGRFARKVSNAVGLAVGYDAANGRDMSTTVVVNKRADGVSEVVGYAHDIAKMSDNEIDAMYGKHSEVARALIGAKRLETRTVGHTVKNRGETVTLATWEHHLPALLDSAPREFRDGFNRRRGPAWEAYLRALAWVKEQIQCKRVAPHSVATAVVLATGKAHGALGAEWVKANVRESLPEWEAVSDSRMGHR